MTLEERVEELTVKYRMLMTKDGLAALVALIEKEKKESFAEGYEKGYDEGYDEAY